MFLINYIIDIINQIMCIVFNNRFISKNKNGREKKEQISTNTIFPKRRRFANVHKPDRIYMMRKR